jgi:hypothetical protein
LPTVSVVGESPGIASSIFDGLYGLGGKNRRQDLCFRSFKRATGQWISATQYFMAAAFLVLTFGRKAQLFRRASTYSLGVFGCCRMSNLRKSIFHFQCQFLLECDCVVGSRERSEAKRNREEHADLLEDNGFVLVNMSRKVQWGPSESLRGRGSC